jgi:hypothetical protein
VTGVGRERLETGEHDACRGIDLRACGAWQIRITPTTADRKHLAQDGNRPGLLVLGTTGIPQFDPLAQKPRALLNMSKILPNVKTTSRSIQDGRCCHGVAVPVDDCRRSIIQRLMQALMVVQRKIATQAVD